MTDLDVRIQSAVRHFWLTRSAQTSRQLKRGVKDQGARSAVTGGKQMDGFVESTRPVSVREPHFEVFPEFKDASYAERCRILLDKLVRERLCDATCFLMTPEDGLEAGDYSQPSPELSFRYFEESLRARVAAFQQLRSGI